MALTDPWTWRRSTSAIFSQIVPFPVGRRQSPVLLAFKFADDLSRRPRNKGQTDENDGSGLSRRDRIAPIIAASVRACRASDCRLKSVSDRTSRRRRSQFVLVVDKSSNLSSRGVDGRARSLGQDKTSATEVERMSRRSGAVILSRQWDVLVARAYFNP